jgi:hypothetical protein
LLTNKRFTNHHRELFPTEHGVSNTWAFSEEVKLLTLAVMEPTEEEIGLVIDFASLDPVQDRTLVIQALKVRYNRPELTYYGRDETKWLQSNGRDTQRVLQEYFEDATSVRSTYIPYERKDHADKEQ